MDEMNAFVLKSFDINNKNIKKEKSFFICSGDDGQTRVLKKSIDTAECIVFQHAVKEQLAEKGFPNTDRFCLSTDGLPYVKHEDGLFVLTLNPNQTAKDEADLTNADMFKNILRTVAEFHKISQEMTFDEETAKIYEQESTKEAYAKRQAEIKANKKWINSQKRMLDFDVVFLKNLKFFQDKIEEAEAIFTATEFETEIEKAKAKNTVIHNNLKEENILVGGGISLVKFSDACIGCRHIDIADLIRRYIKAAPENAITINEVVSVYSEVYPLSESDIKILKYLLLYPQKFVSVCNQYYSKKRSFAPSAIISRMDEVVGQREVYYEYIKGL
jgi:CotS family spore coat protein